MSEDERTGTASNEAASGDWVRFLKTWARRPLAMGAVAPSSRDYCAMMVDKATTGLDGPILELGPGLGVVTRTLIEKGVAPERITSIEYDRDFSIELKKRFEGVNVIHGDGLDLNATLGEGTEKFAAILFAIPIVNMPQASRQDLFRRYFSWLKPGGNLTQLSYMVTPPVLPLDGVFTVSSSPVVWKNIPPARVWIYDGVDRTGSGGPDHRGPTQATR